MPTIRCYEQIGLLPEVERSRATHGSTGPRRLSGSALFATRELGFPLEAVREVEALKAER